MLGAWFDVLFIHYFKLMQFKKGCCVWNDFFLFRFQNCITAQEPIASPPRMWTVVPRHVWQTFSLTVSGMNLLSSLHPLNLSTNSLLVDSFSCWLAGRSVLLEQPRKSGSKVISHMLSSHGGEIFLHVLNSNRSILEDPPSISEGCGGRVTDYRITVGPANLICVAVEMENL